MKRVTVLIATLLLLALAQKAPAHCDTLDGPVVADAKRAIDQNDVTPALKWVAEKDEAEVRQAFTRTTAVRKLGPDAQQLADMYFFETLVRVHRASENAPYTGLKPAGAEQDPAISAADHALETGSAEELLSLVTIKVTEGLKQRFTHAIETRAHAGESVQAGREYVRAYVDFVHYAEALVGAAEGHAVHDAEPTTGGAQDHAH